MSNETIRVKFFKNGSEEFFSLLEDSKIETQKRQAFPPGTIVMSGEYVEIIKAIGGASIIPSLATIIVQWLKNRASRKIMIQTKNKEVIHIEGYSVKQVEQVLETAEKITVIQTKSD